MTATKFEPAAVLSFVQSSRISPPCESSSGCPSRRPPLLSSSPADTLNGCSTFSTSKPLPPDDGCPDLLSLDSDEEDCLSLSSASTASSFSHSGGHERRVSFASQLVTEVRFRARTPEADKPLLFYSEKETTRFRQVYRQERKLNEASDEGGDHDVHKPVTFASTVEPSCERRRISRVVVEHNDNLETFYDFNDLVNPPHQGAGSAGKDDVFFDNDSFWSGSITWY
eukprot:scaffold30235_cov67-Cyclotella_meneghiniana.AAC.1